MDLHDDIITFLVNTLLSWVDPGAPNSSYSKFKILHKNIILRRFWKHFFIFFLAGKRRAVPHSQDDVEKISSSQPGMGECSQPADFVLSVPSRPQPAIKRYIMLKNKNACPDFAFFRVALELKGKLRPLIVEKKLLPENTGRFTFLWGYPKVM